MQVGENPLINLSQIYKFYLPAFLSHQIAKIGVPEVDLGVKDISKKYIKTLIGLLVNRERKKIYNWCLYDVIWSV